MSPYDHTLVDVKFGDGVSGSVTVAIDEGQLSNSSIPSSLSISSISSSLTSTFGFVIVYSTTKLALHIACIGLCVTVFGAICQ